MNISALPRTHAISCPNMVSLEKNLQQSTYIPWSGVISLSIRLLNAALRIEDRSVLESWFGYLKLFDTALEKLPDQEESVWRGINANIVEKLQSGEENDLVEFHIMLDILTGGAPVSRACVDAADGKREAWEVDIKIQ